MHKNNAVNLITNKIKMRQRFIFFLVVLVLMFSGEIFGQAAADSKCPERDTLNPGKPLVIRDCWNIRQMQELQRRIKPEDCKKFPVNYETLSNFIFEKQLSLDFDAGDSIKPERQKLFTFISKPLLAPAFYTKHLGYFCQKELQLQKLTSLPIHFRLGSMDYVNYMEQKPNAVKPR